ncbi:MAG: GNAT family N-acetyltransferase [Parvularculaceae bacterium]|nr:GNAT family N-acetyltransferase [Parvularculaceae bacterium]
MSPADSYVIRQARANDVEPMRALEHGAAQKFRAIGYVFCADGPVCDAIEHVRVMTNGATFVFDTDAGALAGFAMFDAHDAGCHLIEIDVDPAHQGRGLARRLIAAGEDWARERGLGEMTLTTFRDVPWNAPFYARLGFEELTPGPERRELAAVIAQEAASGFAFAPRIAMRKPLL